MITNETTQKGKVMNYKGYTIRYSSKLNYQVFSPSGAYLSCVPSVELGKALADLVISKRS